MKRFYVTAVIAGAMFFSVGSATAQETQNTPTQAATEQTQQKTEYTQVQEQDLPNEVRQAMERDYQGATVAEAYTAEKDGEAEYKLVINTQDGQSQELYADGQGNWIEKDEKDQGTE